MQRIWVLCTHCHSSIAHTFYGAKSIGHGKNCPTCGSNWRENQIIASTVDTSSSPILGDIRTEDEKSTVKVVWLKT